MNFLAGFICKFYSDEAKAFAMFVSLIERLNLSGFYHENPLLANICMYQMNKLIALYLPSLHLKLYEHSISAIYYSSSWFITSFCYILQFTKSNTTPPLLTAFFDKYIFVFFIMIVGWPSNLIKDVLVSTISI